MIFKKKGNNPVTIDKLLGRPTSVNIRKLEALGSPGLILKLFVNKTTAETSLPEQAKCNFEKREKGLLLYSNYNTNSALVALPATKILKIELIKGAEKISPILFSPMWILLKTGVSIRYARYFRFSRNEYFTESMTLKIETVHYQMKFIASGYLFEGHLEFFERLSLEDKFKVNTAA
jgi:hypothetical protein